VKSVNTERLNATATNMLAEFLRANRPDIAHMAFDFWNIPPDDLNSALTELFVSVHKPGIPEHQHNGPLDYSATTLKSYFSSLARVFHTNNRTHRGFSAEPFRSGVAIALDRRIRTMHSTSAHPLPSEPPPVPDQDFHHMWKAVRSADDPIRHSLRLFLVTATIFGDVDDSLYCMRVDDFSETVVDSGIYAGRNVLIFDKPAVDARAGLVNRKGDGSQSKLAMHGERQPVSTTCKPFSLSEEHLRSVRESTERENDAAGAVSVGDSWRSSSSAGTQALDERSKLVYIIDMPELGEENNYAILKDFLHHRPVDAPGEFWLQNSNWRSCPRSAYYLRSPMGKERVGSLTELLYAG
jgi:hypothetical protein